MISRAKPLASITAAGMGAIALTGGKAEAAIIDSGILNTNIIFSSNSDPTGDSILVSSRPFATFASGPAFALRAFGKKRSTGSYSRKIPISRGCAGNTSFGIKSGGGVDHFPLGAAWGAVTPRRWPILRARRTAWLRYWARRLTPRQQPGLWTQACGGRSKTHV